MGHATGSAVGRTADTLGPAPVAAAEGSAAEGPATTEELEATVEPTVEGPTAGGVGPWRT